jgi:hypothetical protein
VIDYSPFDLHLVEPDESDLKAKIEKIRNKQCMTAKKKLASPWSLVSAMPTDVKETLLPGQEITRNIGQLSVSYPSCVRPDF